MEAALFHTGAIHVLLDGVDEVCPAYKHKLLRCLHLLAQSRAALVWVTTRPEVEEEVSQALGCHPCTLRPLSKEQQESFLCSHWANAADGNLSAAAFRALAEEVTDALHGAMGRHQQRCLLDVPLYAMMAAEAFQEAAVEALRSGGALLTQRNITLHDLYRRFVHTKRDLYRERYGLNDPKFQILGLPDLFDDIHDNCAMFVLISGGKYEEVDPQPFRDFVARNKDFLERDKNGLLWVHSDGTPHFAHYTLVDFFAARWLVRERGALARAVWRQLVEDGGAPLLRDFVEHQLAEGKPLHKAVLADDARSLDAALHSADLQGVDAWGRGALAVAASLGRVGAVGALLAAGEDVGRQDALLGWSALRFAAAGRHLAVAEQLLEAGADCSQLALRDPRVALLEAAELGLERVMGYLLTQSINFNKNGLQEMPGSEDRVEIHQILQLTQYSSQNNQQEREKLNDTEKEKPNSRVETESQTETRFPMEALAILACGLDENTALNIAVLKGHRSVAELLIKAGAAVNDRSKSGITPLIFAVLGRHVGTLQLLLQNGADISASTVDKYTPLHIASFLGHAELAKQLIEHGANVNARNNDASTPLMLATMSGFLKFLIFNIYSFFTGGSVDLETDTYASLLSDHHAVAKLLIEKGAHVNKFNTKGLSPLLCAAMVGKVEMVKLLLGSGADASQREYDGTTTLHCASRPGHRDVAALFLEKGADVNACDSEETTPLMAAAIGGNVDTVNLLLEKGANVMACDVAKNTALHYASLKGHHDVARLLLQRGADVNARNYIRRTPLMLTGCAETASLLLQNGADVSATCKNGNTALHYASSRGRTAVTKLLIENGAAVRAVNARGITPRVLAARCGNVRAMRLLQRNGAEPGVGEEVGSISLHYSSSRGHHDMAKHLIEKGADVNAFDEEGLTPIMLAAESGSVETVQLLLREGASINTLNSSRNTALHYASLNRNREVIEFLVQNGADVNASNDTGSTPLIYAAKGGCAECARLLIENGADISTCDTEKNTALHFASLKGHRDVAKLLLKIGADIDAPSISGNTPLMNAAQSGNVPLVDLLLRHGAAINTCTVEQANALHYALINKHEEVAKRLIGMGARLSKPRTDLLRAVSDTNVESVKRTWWGYQCTIL